MIRWHDAFQFPTPGTRVLSSISSSHGPSSDHEPERKSRPPASRDGTRYPGTPDEVLGRRERPTDEPPAADPPNQ
eukprot:2669192-Rhodomonas_salina.1